MMYYALKPKPEVILLPSIDVNVPQVKSKSYATFMKKNAEVLDDANNMMLEFLQGLHIPGYDMKVDSDKLRRMLTHYIYRTS